MWKVFSPPLHWAAITAGCYVRAGAGLAARRRTTLGDRGGQSDVGGAVVASLGPLSADLRTLLYWPGMAVSPSRQL